MIDTSFEVYDENVIDIYSNKISIAGQQHNIKPGYYKVLNMTRDDSNGTALVYILEDDWRFRYDEDMNNAIKDAFMVETIATDDETYGIRSFFDVNTYHDNHAMKTGTTQFNVYTNDRNSIFILDDVNIMNQQTLSNALDDLKETDLQR